MRSIVDAIGSRPLTRRGPRCRARTRSSPTLASPLEVIDDPQVIANGYLAPHPTHPTLRARHGADAVRRRDDRRSGAAAPGAGRAHRRGARRGSASPADDGQPCREAGRNRRARLGEPPEASERATYPGRMASEPDGLLWDERPSRLRHPVLVAGVRGLERRRRRRHRSPRRGSRSTATATRAARRSTPRSTSTSRRDGRTCELVDGVTRAVTWPENMFFTWRATGTRPRRAPRDRAVATSGSRSRVRCSTSPAKPDARWSSRFGALLADVPHTRDGARHRRGDRPRA